MPKYCVIVTNVADHNSRTPFQVGSSQVEYCDAPNPETVTEMVKKSIQRTTDPDLYTWTITEQP